MMSIEPTSRHGAENKLSQDKAEQVAAMIFEAIRRDLGQFACGDGRDPQHRNRRTR
jgi:hypothetical protein